MTTDNPRELREAADTVLRAAADTARAALVPGSCLTHAANCAAWTLAKAWLATVRDDDGEEQPDVTYELEDGTDIEVSEAGVWAKSFTQFDVIHLLHKRPTRGQFRALCRGLGITPEAATPETPG